MPAINDADGHVAQVTPEGLLQVAINGTVAQANVGVKNSLDARINPTTEEKLEAVRALLDAEDFATQTTLEAIRALFAAEDFATQATLEALRLLYSQRTGKTVQQYAEGKFRAVATKVTVPALNSGIIQLQNPTGSGVSITVVEFTTGVTTDAEVAVWRNSVLTTPTVISSFNPNRFFATSATKGIVNTANAATGGEEISIFRVDSSDTPKPRAFTYTFPPGESVSLRAIGLATEYTLYGGVTWIEEVL